MVVDGVDGYLIAPSVVINLHSETVVRVRVAGIVLVKIRGTWLASGARVDFVDRIVQQHGRLHGW